MVLVVALVGVGAGVVATRGMLGASSGAHGSGAAAAGVLPGVGQTVPTSFGFVTVSHVDHIKGLSQQDLASANHGVANLVESGKEQVQVSLELTSNLAKETAPYTPEQFTLLAGDGESLAPVTTTVHAGRLQPYASVQGHLGFVVPADGERLKLRFADPGGAEVVIDLDAAGVDTRAPADHADHPSGGK
jgi:hypothetical protein